MAYRGLISAARLHGIYDVGRWSMWIGPGQSFLTYPVSAGALLNVVGLVPADLDVEESWSAPGDVAALAAAYDRWDTQDDRSSGPWTTPSDGASTTARRMLTLWLSSA
jgi:salicylate hydroxylase